MRNLVIAGNWKMNGSQTFAQEMREALDNAEFSERITTVVFPPFLAIHTMLGSDKFAVGAQNCYTEQSGAYTGEVSPELIADAGCQYVLVGHSERRTLLGETDQVVGKKVKLAVSAGLTPVLCVGETLDERESGNFKDVVEQQVVAGLKELSGDEVKQVVVAYEPVWAIGTGKTASADQAQEVHAHIRSVLNSAFDGAGDAISILYGGSVKSENAAELLGCADIDGGLIGGASLNSKEFITICRIAADSH